MRTPGLIPRIPLAFSLALVAACTGVALLVPPFANATPQVVIDSPTTVLQGTAWGGVITFTDPDAVNATGYNLYRALKAGSCGATTMGSPYGSPAGPSATSFTDPSPADGADYCYWVESVGSASAISDPVEVAYDGSAPSSSIDLAMTSDALTSTAPTFTYSPDSDVNGAYSYQLYRGTTAIGSPSATGTLTDSGAPDGLNNYSVHVTDQAGNETTVSAPDATVDTTAPPSATFTMTTGSLTSVAPTFTYTADSDANGAYAYQLYRGATAIGSPSATGTLTDPLPGNHSTDGLHSYSVHITDQAGNETTVSVASATIDTVDPTVTITSGKPANPAGTAGASFTFSVSEGTPVCTVDSVVVTCTSSTTMLLGSLSDGSHTFDVSSTDGAGNTGDDSYTWTVDTHGPVVTISPVSEPANPSGSSAASFSFSATDATTTVGTPVCKLDSGSYGSCTTSTTKTFSGLADGSHTFTVKFPDSVPNYSIASYTWTVDTTAPVVTISPVSEPANPSGSSAASFSFSATDATTTVGTPQCKIDSGSYGTCTTATTNGVSSLADGSHTFTVQFPDSLSNYGTASYTWTVDTHAPVVTISPVSEPNDPSGSSAASFSFSATDATTTVGTPQCKIDAGSYGACTSSTTKSFSGLADGSHTFTVQFPDSVSNLGTASYTWTVDTIAPVVTLTPTGGLVNPTSSTSASFSFSATDATTTVGTPQCKLDAGSYGACTTSSIDTILGPLADGSHTFTVEFPDGALNQGTGSYTWVVDHTPPSVPASFALIGPGTRNTHPVFTYGTSVDPPTAHNPVSYELYKNGVDTGIGTLSGSVTDSVTALDGSADGTYTYQVAAVDALGNRSALSNTVAVTINAGPPSVPGNVHVAASPTRSSPVITWNASSGGPTSYQVLRDGSPIGTVVAPTTTFTDSALSLSGSADGTHTYTVIAIDALGNASAPSTGAAVVLDTTRPAPASSLAVTSPTAAKPVLVWAASADPAVAGYNVYRGSTPLNTAPITGTSFTDTSISGDGSFTYTVRTVDTAGNESLDSAAATVVYDTTAPTPPTSATATSSGAGAAKLSWLAASDGGSGIGSYQVRRSAPNGAAPTTLAEGTPVCGVLGASVLSCSDTGLAAGATYRYSVFAADAVGNVSAAGGSAPLALPAARDTTAPKAPTTVKNKVANSKVVLTWKNPAADLAKIVIVWNATRAPRSSSDGKLIYSGKATTFSVPLAKLPAGKKVRFGVFALDAAGNASPAATATVAVPQAGPLSVAPGGKLSGSPTLSWKTIADTQYYNVQVFEGSGTTKRVAIAWPYTTHWALPSAGLVKGKTYTWYVWPGIGAKKAAKYGALIGHQTFTYTG